jgi:WD40 repeat protein
VLNECQVLQFVVCSDYYETRSVVMAPIYISKVLCSNFDATGTYFVTGCSDNVARVWVVSSTSTTGSLLLLHLKFQIGPSIYNLTAFTSTA